jgi:hypothetical protein
MVASKQSTVTERRALLTDREREIIAGDADVEDSYRYQTISRVRARFARLEGDLEALEKHGALADELRDTICPEREGGNTRREAPDPDPLGDALLGWAPDTEAEAKSARGQTRRAAEYLQDHAPERFKRGELQDALAGESSYGRRHWWERAVQPGLQHLAEQGVVEYRGGYHDYRWAGEATET